jgi:hypothetical protein
VVRGREPALGAVPVRCRHVLWPGMRVPLQGRQFGQEARQEPVQLRPQRAGRVLALVARLPDRHHVVGVDLPHRHRHARTDRLFPLPADPQRVEVGDHEAGPAAGDQRGHLPHRIALQQDERDAQAGQLARDLSQARQQEPGLPVRRAEELRHQAEGDRERPAAGQRHILGVEQGPVVADALVAAHPVEDRTVGELTVTQAADACGIEAGVEGQGRVLAGVARPSISGSAASGQRQGEPPGRFRRRLVAVRGGGARAAPRAPAGRSAWAGSRPCRRRGSAAGRPSSRARSAR